MRNWETTGLLNFEDKNGDGLIQYYNDAERREFAGQAAKAERAGRATN